VPGVEFSPIQKRVLRLALTRPAPSRLELSRLMGVSPQTLTRAVRPLVDSDVLSEQPVHNGMPGQPIRALTYREGRLAVLGLVLTQDRISVTAEDVTGARYIKKLVTGVLGSPDKALPLALELIDECRAGLPAQAQVLGLGVAAQGFFTDRGRRIIARGNPAAWSEVDLYSHLRVATNLPVTIQNDARAIAAGSLRMPVATRFSHYFCLFLSTGVGGALVIDGDIYDGPHGNAGEIGALLPESSARPTTPNFLAAAGLARIEDWRGFDELPQADRARLEDWCTRAGAQLSVPMEAVLALLDVQAVFVFSQIPREVIERICGAIALVPVGATLAGVPASALKKVKFAVQDDTSLDRGACAVALSHFFNCPHNRGGD
jgi:predicted NBD/HSP70 family sugar kinase